MEQIPIYQLVQQDIEERDRVGRESYGQSLYADTQVDPMLEAYHEALDLVIYFRAEIERRKADESKTES